MKSFFSFILENPIITDMEDVGHKNEEELDVSDHVGRLNEKGYTSKLRRKKLNPSYSIIHSEHTPNESDRVKKHQFFLIHNQSGKLAGRFSADENEPGTFHMNFARIHPEHRGQKLSHSFYRKLLGSGHTLVSDDLQTLGGAKIWHDLLSVPSLRKRASVIWSNGESQPISAMTQREIWNPDDPNRIKIKGSEK